MSLIDRDALKERMLSYYDCVNPSTAKENYRGETLMNYEVADMIVDCIDNAPVVDAKPVVHGEWVLKHIGAGHYWECSACHKNPCIYVTEDTNFCPHCGADMRGNGDGEE